MQLPLPSDAAPLGTAPSEDCLYLSVWKPAQTTGRLPVLVWIYGGGWVNGGASPATYSGANLAREGILVASFNYRIGRFGWFAHPQLTRENADNGLRINYGTLDQIAALKWIQKNIAAFGGDPDNVTVMGESAGGVSLHVLNTSTLERQVAVGFVRIDVAGPGRPIGERHHEGFARGRFGLQPHPDLAVHLTVHPGEDDLAESQDAHLERHVRSVLVPGEDVLASGIVGVIAHPPGAAKLSGRSRSVRCRSVGLTRA